MRLGIGNDIGYGECDWVVGMRLGMVNEIEDRDLGFGICIGD